MSEAEGGRKSVHFLFLFVGFCFTCKPALLLHVIRLPTSLHIHVSCFNVPNSGLAERHLQPLHQRRLFSPWFACQRRYICPPSSWWEKPQDWVAKRPMPWLCEFSRVTKNELADHCHIHYLRRNSDSTDNITPNSQGFLGTLLSRRDLSFQHLREGFIYVLADFVR